MSQLSNTIPVPPVPPPPVLVEVIGLRKSIDDLTRRIELLGIQANRRDRWHKFWLPLLLTSTIPVGVSWYAVRESRIDVRADITANNRSALRASQRTVAAQYLAARDAYVTAVLDAKNAQSQGIQVTSKVETQDEFQSLSGLGKSLLLVFDFPQLDRELAFDIELLGKVSSSADENPKQELKLVADSESRIRALLKKEIGKE
jgi:hypothetical protein